MAMLRLEPTPVHVKTDWFDGRPREITWADERLPITSHALVREETSAYPVETGPRTFFEVETPRARFQLTFRHRLDVGGRSRGPGRAPGSPSRSAPPETTSARGPNPPSVVHGRLLSGRARRYRACPASASRLPSRVGPAIPRPPYNPRMPSAAVRFRDLTLAGFVERARLVRARARWWQRLGGGRVARCRPRGDGRGAVGRPPEIRRVRGHPCRRECDRAGPRGQPAEPRRRGRRRVRRLRRRAEDARGHRGRAGCPQDRRCAPLPGPRPTSRSPASRPAARWWLPPNRSPAGAT